MVQKFSQNCEGAKFLLKQFQLFDQDNTKGISYHISKPAEIELIYSKYPAFHIYSSKAFKTTNFKNHAALYKLSKLQDRGRSQCKLYI
jgi:hypothetical protein